MSMIITTGDDRDDDTIDLPDLDGRDEERDDDDRAADGSDGRTGEKRRASSSGDDDESDDDEEEEDPVALRATIKRLRASLAKSNSTGLRRRNQLKELRKASAVLAGNDDDDTDDEDDESGEKPKQERSTLDARAVQKRIERARKEARREADVEHTKDLIDTRAESALSKAGADDKAIRLLKRELDYDDLELLKDRTVDGLEEEIDRLKSEFPNLFRGNKAARRRINGGDDRDAPRSKRALSTNEKQALILKGQA